MARNINSRWPFWVGPPPPALAALNASVTTATATAHGTAGTATISSTIAVTVTTATARGRSTPPAAVTGVSVTATVALGRGRTAKPTAQFGVAVTATTATARGSASAGLGFISIVDLSAPSRASAGVPTVAITNPPPNVPYLGTFAQITGSAFTYYSYDLLTGTLIGSFPARSVTFGQQLNTPGTGSFTIDLSDPRVRATNPIACTIPNRTLTVIDYQGAILWAGINSTRRWQVGASTSDTQRTLTVQAVELWAYFQQRVQATDYSAPPSSGITTPMALWNPPGGIGGPWDATLIAAQVIGDAIGYTDSGLQPAGNLLGGLGLLINGATPSAATPVVPGNDYVDVTYPFTTLQTVDTIVTQLSQLGLGAGFDFGVDVAYSNGSGSAPIATINISYPRRGRTVAQNNLTLDLTTARSYEFPEDGTQTANQVYELGGSGAIVVSENINPISQGYPLWERVFMQSYAQSQNIIQLLAQIGLSNLALYSYAPVVPTVTIGMFDPNLPIGSYTIGDDVQLVIPSTAGDGGVFDSRFPAGLNQEWQVQGWAATLPDEGDATVQLTFGQPPFLQALVPPI